MTLDLDHLKEIAEQVERSGSQPYDSSPSTFDEDDWNFRDAFDPPTALALIVRLEEAETLLRKVADHEGRCPMAWLAYAFLTRDQEPTP
jgi:hypothetical protein